MKKTLFVSMAGLAILGFLVAFSGVSHKSQAGVYGTHKELLKSMEDLFAINDQWAMDAEPFPVWGPYWCAHFTKGKGTMIHFTKDASRDDADIVLLVQAEPFIEKAGLNTDAFPQLDGPPPYGPGLTSGQWYYLPKFKLLVLPMSVNEIGMKNDLVPKI
jgi:hypothetical protein